MKVYTIATLLIMIMLGCISYGQNLVVNEGFETMEVTGWGPPSSYGDWGYDYSMIVPASPGVVPYEGIQMLQFLATGWEDYSAGSAGACQVYQIIDVSAYTDDIANGIAVAQANMYCNRIAGNEQTDTEFLINLMAFTGDPANFWDQIKYSGNWIARQDASFISDADPATWQPLDVSLTLPVNTDYIAVGVHAVENIFNNDSTPEFDGHFADMVSVEVVPEPCTLLLLGIGGLAVRFKQSR